MATYNELLHYMFSKVSSVYAEILSYEPFRYVLKHLKVTRPPMGSEIGDPMFKFVCNVLALFPFFDTWDDIWVNRVLVDWQREGQQLTSLSKDSLVIKRLSIVSGSQKKMV